MSERFDLTRWNRAGLSRFRYLNGNAVTHLEDLRKAFLAVAKFADWDVLSAIEPVEVVSPNSDEGEIAAASAPRWLNSNQVPSGETGKSETESEKIERLLENYNREREDWAWEISRAFARACHVLTEHVDCYANEGFLGTATQWDNVRRLVEMIDYHPAPPASASTPLIIKAKEGLSGTIEAGFQAKYAPSDGSEPLIFETLDDLEVDSQINEIRPLNYNRNQDTQSGKSFIVDEVIEDLVIGEPLVLEDENNGNLFARIVTGFSTEDTGTRITLDQTLPEPEADDSLTKGYMKIHAIPKDRLTLLGPAEEGNVQQLDTLHLTTEPEELLPEMVVYISDGNNHYYRFISSLTQNCIELSNTISDLYLSKAQVGLPVLISATKVTDGGSGVNLIQPIVENMGQVIEVGENVGAVYKTSSANISLSSKGSESGNIENMGFSVENLQAAKAGESVEVKSKVPNTGRDITFQVGEDGSVQYKVAGDWERLAGKKIAIAMEKNNPISFDLISVDYHECVENEYDSLRGYTVFKIADNSNLNPDQDFLVPPANDGEWKTDTFLERDDNTNTIPSGITTEEPQKTSAGDIAVIVRNGGYAWARLESVSLNAEDEEASLTAESGREEYWKEYPNKNSERRFYLTETTVFGHFSKELRIHDWQVNNLSLTGTDVSTETVPDCLDKGRRVIVVNEDNSDLTLDTTVADIQNDNDTDTVILSDPLPSGFTYGNTVLRGNVVTCGHGESKGEKVLGSGDATRSNQSFLFKEEGVSFTADATQLSGVRAAIDVQVNGETWEQVGNLNYSEPTDKQYTIRMAEDGYLLIGFGDGRKGRRLPTGTNNVRLTYRKGAGLSGNISAGGITKPAKPNRLVDTIQQPFAATGGNDMEGVESLRENAPATLLTLERAVSLTDYSNLANSHSSVWQAKAFSLPTGLGRNEIIEVVVVPANGGLLGDLKETLRSYIAEYSLPNVTILVEDYESISFSLDVILNVNTTGYDPEEVVVAVKAALEDEFSLKNRKLGQAVYLSEVYKIVEATAGVENSRAELNEDPDALKIPTNNTNNKRAVQIIGECIVTYVSSTTQTSTGLSGPGPTSPPSVVLSIGARDPSIIQGIGTKYQSILASQGVRTIEGLAKLDPEISIAGIASTRRWWFSTRARIILESEFDSSQLYALQNYSVMAILQSPTSDLYNSTGLSTDVISETKSSLRRLQSIIDDEVLEQVTLRELSKSSR
ncbi:hypothetical protein CEE37_12280 [candidate division LCP-89 bacterium B3_LCP]|uniref:Uncharacterized protein n=1 Tax=candidate division LCP-89 bacterium B3_LCP TaxID=2012998 RepID=A0A532UUB7_UNCL8|nr:MAG: hypothetical protein CEE37_12280 [candidate division LCP-89 bacterium B3_LCP]